MQNFGNENGSSRQISDLEKRAKLLKYILSFEIANSNDLAKLPYSLAELEVATNSLILKAKISAHFKVKLEKQKETHGLGLYELEIKALFFKLSRLSSEQADLEDEKNLSEYIKIIQELNQIKYEIKNNFNFKYLWMFYQGGKKIIENLKRTQSLALKGYLDSRSNLSTQTNQLIKPTESEQLYKLESPWDNTFRIAKNSFQEPIVKSYHITKLPSFVPATLFFGLILMCCDSLDENHYFGEQVFKACLIFSCILLSPLLLAGALIGGTIGLLNYSFFKLNRKPLNEDQQKLLPEILSNFKNKDDNAKEKIIQDICEQYAPSECGNLTSSNSSYDLYILLLDERNSLEMKVEAIQSYMLKINKEGFLGNNGKKMFAIIFQELGKSCPSLINGSMSAEQKKINNLFEFI